MHYRLKRFLKVKVLENDIVTIEFSSFSMVLVLFYLLVLYSNITIFKV